jgi:hypothetical protein
LPRQHKPSIYFYDLKHTRSQVVTDLALLEIKRKPG